MKRRELLAATAATSLLVLASCNTTQTNPNNGTVDYILVEKKKRVLTLYSQNKKVKTYKIHLGFSPLGHKKQENDGKTPEGKYTIWKKNPNSAFHLSLWISYPNQADVDQATARGVSPGGEIFIHGGPNRKENMNKNDWTAGCIAVTDQEIEEIYNYTKIGAIIEIRA